METDQGTQRDPLSPLIADAAADSSAMTAAAIDKAAAVNDDPEVGAILDKAAVAADQTVSRVGWLQSFVHRFFTRSA